ncbi:unnamed protein product [Cuscuta campestris]|uniref:Uncharacterized protein n=1 Tax=Cuscuta campestris TaxID=132261 RepID=A0A484LSE7_9ASTE|nr:unnamed protein product [Cuscuta campestris]
MRSRHPDPAIFRPPNFDRHISSAAFLDRRTPSHGLLTSWRSSSLPRRRPRSQCLPPRLAFDSQCLPPSSPPPLVSPPLAAASVSTAIFPHPPDLLFLSRATPILLPSRFSMPPLIPSLFLCTGIGFDSISQTLGQVRFFKVSSR